MILSTRSVRPITKHKKESFQDLFLCFMFLEREANEVRPFKEMSEKEKLVFLFPNDAER